jgi:hypothetical protein
MLNGGGGEQRWFLLPILLAVVSGGRSIRQDSPVELKTGANRASRRRSLPRGRAPTHCRQRQRQLVGRTLL